MWGGNTFLWLLNHKLLLKAVTQGLFVCLFSRTYEKIKGKKTPVLLKKGNVKLNVKVIRSD